MRVGLGAGRGWEAAIPLEWGRKRPSLPEVRSPTVRRRELGARLRALRQECGLTVEQVAERLLCSPSKVSRMETGQRGATLRDVRDLCDLYGVTGEDERERLMYLARQGKRPGWWQGYELDYFATYVGLEEAAVGLRQYQSSTIPGLLQTEGYARALAQTLLPDASPAVYEVSPKRVEEFVEVKMRRQDRLTKEPIVAFSAVLDEAVLYRVVGGPDNMARQLDHLVHASELDNVSIQVIPYSVGAHIAMDSSFTILRFVPGVPSLVYVEGLLGYVYLERSQDIARYERVFDHLCDNALTPQESIELIAKISADHRRGAGNDVRGR